MPETSLRVPAVPEKYELFSVDDIDIYITRAALTGTDKIEFDLRGVWVFKEIVANGINYPKI